MAKYETLSAQLTERMKQDALDNTRPSFAAKSTDAIRRDNSVDRESIWRPAYARDTDKILHSPFYNRYTEQSVAASSTTTFTP